MKSHPAFPLYRERLVSPTHRGGARRLIAAVALTSLLSGSLLSLNGCKGQSFNIGPSTGEVVGAIAGVGAVVGVTTYVLVHEHHAHHQVKGCVSSGANGFEVETEDKKRWLLTGNTAGIPVGSLVKFHGNKLKQLKHSAGARTFEIRSIGKNYGPCRAVAAVTAELTEQDALSRAR